MTAQRTAEERIQALELQIAAVRAIDAKRKARRDPAVSQALIAIKAVDRSLAAGPNASMKAALQEVRGTLSACVAVTGLVVPESTVTAQGKPRGRKRKSAA